MKFVTQFTHSDERSELYGTTVEGESMTQQSDLQDSDINVIWDRYTRSGQIPQISKEGLSGDFTQVRDYRGALEMVRAAEEAFYEVPAAIRKKFDNDPGEYIAFVHNPDNLEEMRKLGIANPLEEKETTLADVVTTLRELKPQETK